MSFSLPRFLRRTPPSALSLYFSARRIALPDGFDWNATPRVFLAEVRDAIDDLTEVNQEQVFADFERVDQLCDPIGQRALFSLVAGDHTLLERIQSADSNETRGIIVLTETEAVLDHALAVSYAERHRNGRSWSAFSLPSPANENGDLERLKALEADLATVLTEFDGTGRKIKIDSFQTSEPRPRCEADSPPFHLCRRPAGEPF